MNAKISYKMSYQPDPFHRAHLQDTELWVLWEVVTSELGETDTKVTPIATFNLDSEARRFQAHIFASGLDDKLISIDREMKRMLEAERSRR